MRVARWLPALTATALAMLLAAPAAGHRLAPSYLELREETGGRVQVLWRTPRLRARGAALEPVLPAHCVAAAPGVEDTPSAQVRRLELTCPDGGLVGARLGVRGLDASGTDALVHVVLADGRVVRSLLSAHRPSLRIPPRERAWDVLRGYGRLGVEHLLGGLDHLLFVTGLLFLVQGRRLLGAITGFTVGHSVTLALATLGALALPPRAVEVGIAGSLVLLACQIEGRDARRLPGRLSVERSPVAVCFAFGLLHGLGFAGALGALGLPPDAIPLALLGFNAGIELGQLLVVAGLAPAVWALGRLPWRGPRRAAALPATVVGSLGVFWLLERLTPLP